MSRRLRSIQGSLARLLAGLILPLLAVQGWIYWDRYQAAYELQRRLEIQSAVASAAAVGQRLSELREDLGAFAALLPASLADPAPAEVPFRLLAQTHRALLSVTLLGRDGAVLGILRSPRAGPTSPAPVAPARTGAAGAGPSPTADGGWVMVMESKEGPAGRLVVRLDPAGLDAISAAEHETGALVAPGPRLLSAPPARTAADPWAGPSGLVSAPVVAAALAGQTGATSASAPDGTSWIVAAAPVPGTPWAVLTAEPRADAEREVARRLLPHAAAFVLTLALGGLLATVLGRRLTTPVIALERSAEAFGAGDLERRVRPDGPLEVARLGASFNEMAARIAALVEQVEARAEETAVVLAQREDLLHAVSHDLRTPLSAVALEADLVRRRIVSRGGDEALSPHLDRILVGCRRMDTMIADLVDYARLESGQLRLQRVTVEVGGFLTELLDRLSGLLDLGRVRLEVAPDTPPALADPARLERVVVNLLTNALRYGAPGTPIRLRAGPSAGEVVIAVADEGPGLTQAEIDGLFQRFHRLAATEHRAAGLGLGLYVSRLLVEAQGGRVWVESTPGQGSTFYVALPTGEGAL